ncbi:MAG TPA: hypothetical protein VHV76_07235 [Mycobacteriales bacterium]|jgi:hypothetical protein|nr:hypothetical protein [Mycobacteriales bacterium]
MPTASFDFRFSAAYRLGGLPFGVTPWTARVELEFGELSARFGPWRLQTPLSNVRTALATGPYGYLKTVGPPHLSFADRGLTFATNRDAGVCIQFAEPVPAIDPFGRIRHPAVTVTVADIEGLQAALAAG